MLSNKQNKQRVAMIQSGADTIKERNKRKTQEPTDRNLLKNLVLDASLTILQESMLKNQQKLSPRLVSQLRPL